MIQINYQNLPPLNETALELQSAVQNPKLSIKELTDIIKKDPFVQADILKEINSPLYAMRRDITSIDQAVSLLGVERVKPLLLFRILKMNTKDFFNSYGISSEEFMDYVKAKVLIFKELSDKREIPNVSLIESLLFIGDIGNILIDETIPETQRESFRKDLKIIGVYHAEKAYIGMDSSEVSAEILKKWNFDSKFYDILFDSAKDKPETPEGIVLKAINESVSIDGEVDQDILEERLEELS